MCLRAHSDLLTNHIINNGRWGDCDILVGLWDEKLCDKKVVAADPEGIFLDVGANIGSCTLLMAAAGHRTIGFEPVKSNFFYLSAAVLGNDPKIAERITLYRMGLGDKSTTTTAHTATDNAGNTVLDIAVKDFPTQTFSTEDLITVGTMDEIFWSDPTTVPPHIRVMKIDVQGYELKVFKGATRLMKAGAIGVIKAEFSPEFFTEHGIQASDIANFLEEHYYEIRREDGQLIGKDYRRGEIVARWKGPPTSSEKMSS